jgi:hypothetical protein
MHQRTHSDPALVKPKKRSKSPSPDPSSIPLPSGWEAKVDPSNGKTFYVDHVNKKTQWTHPALAEKKEKKKKVRSRFFLC